MRTCRFRALQLLLVAVAITGNLWAQYFGQNKVRYKDMDFQVLETEHFDIHYYPVEREATVLAGQMAERWYDRLGTILQHELPLHQPIILYDSAPAFRQTTVIPGQIGVGTGGVTEGLRRRVVLPFAGPLAETDHVLGHELVHAYQYDMTSGPGNATAGGAPGVATLPLWFVEGMAEYLSLGPVDPNTAMWLRDAVARDALPKWDQLNDPDYFPYRFGHAFWAYVAGTYGDSVTGRMLRVAGRAHSVESAVGSVLNLTPEALIENWHRALRDAYEPVIRGTEPASEQARTVVAAGDSEMSLNVSPVVSPDGTKAVIFSQRDLFSIDLYLLDVATGQVQQKLTESAVDPHLDSMEFIQSAGAWSPDSKRFVYTTIRTGWPNLAIYDFDRRGVTDRIEFKQVGEIFTPTWSPDGTRIAFSAIAGGLLDLYSYELQSERLERLTNDAFAEMHPSWSPSGNFIAFSSDRFSADLDTLTQGQFRLGLLNVATKAIEPLPALAEGKHIDPNWGMDDNTLYFLSNGSGVSNIYRMQRDTGDISQVTSLRTGATGIVALSPALSVAKLQGTVLFSAFSDGKYSIYALNPQTPAVDPVPFTFLRAATLPPTERTENAIEEARMRPTATVPPTASFETHEYKPALELDYVAPPSISAGVGSYGAMVGGGTALYWSDLLEQHQVMTSFQSIASSSRNILRNISALGGYQNQKSRWTWGFIGGQVPYLTGGYSASTGSIEGEPVVVEQSTTIWQIERQATGILSYPFNRAMRMEFTGGYRNIGFAAEARSDVFSAINGQFLGSQVNNLDAPAGLHMGAASAALVYDTSIFGGTSPVWGRRFRIEAGSQSGSLTYNTALVDLRQYYRLPANLTLAFRGMHYGRYGGGAEDQRLQDLFLGYPALLRGYTAGSFNTSECGAQLSQNGTCPAFDQLLGSRIAVGNAELRIPLIGALGLIPSRGYPPVEIAPFFDAAYAWRSTERLQYFRNNGREPIRSYGGTVRANVLGFFVAQISYVNPLDRPQGWHWEFSILPGF